MSPTQAELGAVARGAALLDDHEPGWYRRIDRDQLNIGSTARCVIGQVYGESCRYGIGYTAMVYNLGIDNASEYGFDSPGGGGYQRLRTAWLDEIDHRLLMDSPLLPVVA